MTEAKKLGALLIEAGLINETQLQRALEHQKIWGGKLGSTLIDMEFVQEEDVARVIAKQLRTPRVNLFESEIPEPILKTIKVDLVKKYNVVPVRKEAGTLVVAMSNPLDCEVIDALRFATGLSIKPALALESELRDAIRKYYDHEEVVHELHPAQFKEIATGTTDEGEIIHEIGSDVAKYAGEPALVPHPVPAPQQTAPADREIPIEALIRILIEKKIFTRDELVKMASQLREPSPAGRKRSAA
jgi:hypothetical protein